MRLMRAAAIAAMMIMVAAPAVALTVKNTDTKEQSIAVDTGSFEAVYKIAPGATVDVNVDCTSGCAVTGPWGFSWNASVDDALVTDGKSLVTTTKAVKWSNAKIAASAPVAKPAAVTSEAMSNAPAPKKKKFASKAKHKKVAQKAKKDSPYFRGSFASLLTGRVDR